MWSVYTVICYFALALLIPIGWAMAKTWRYARQSRQLTYPETGALAGVGLDPRFAMRRHAAGAYEFRVLRCSRWPERRECAQECLAQIPPRFR